jgi:signal transduction histidine kinase/ligand-binding sensor domain-containing protein
MAVAGSGLALDPSSPTRDFIRTDFTVEDGLPSNVVNAIVQTRNGFLWIGTDAGLVRFNGRRFIPIYFRAPQPAPQGIVRALAEGPDGDLWVGTGAGLARIARPALDFFDQSFSVFYHPGAGSSDEISCLRFAPDGSLWVGTNTGLYRFKDGRFVRVLSGVVVNRIEKASEGHLLIGTQQGFVEWDGTRIVGHRALARQLGIAEDQIFDVFQDHKGALWFCTLAGLARREGDRIERFPGFDLPGKALRAEEAYEDDRGTMWVQFSDGLYRVSTTTPELLVRSSVREIYSDRDGDLWAGTNGEGLQRFKDRPVRMFTKEDGLPSNIPMTVLSRRDGSLWVGNNCGGLSVFDHHRFHTYAEKDGLSNSCVWALAEDHDNNLWVGTWGGGLFRFAGGHFTQLSKPQGLAGDVVRGIQVARDGSLWIAAEGGVSHILNGQLRNYSLADGLSSNRVLAVYQDRFGVIWAGTSHGIDRMTGDRFVPVSSPERILGPRCMNFGEDPSGDLYAMDAPKGIDRMDGTRFVNIDHDLDLFNMAAFHEDLWFSGGNGLFRFAVRALKKADRERDAPLDYTSFGSADGMNSTQCSIGTPNMAITRDGKLWIATVKGLAELDLRRLPTTSSKPAIFVSEVTVGRSKQIAGRGLLLPPGTHHTELHFDSISLKSPEKIRFQYRMDGTDPVWLDADSSLTAVYTNIPVGAHSFHVRACNSDGVWDPIGIAYPVTQQPYVYQTVWFRLGVVTTFAFLLAVVYWLRLRQIAHQYNLRLDERVSERTRIARELHDTLLQSFHGLMLRFQAVQNMLPEQPVQAKESLQIAIDRAAEAITEGRDAVQELRSSRISSNALVQTLTSLGQELGTDQANSEGNKAPAKFRVLVEGTPRHVHPTLHDDLYRIAREAVGNAFRHSHASQIEVDIRYDRRMLRLRVRDDGIGMNPNVAQGGRPRHWGIQGMGERARSIGGQFAIWSELNQGTEIEVTIPAPIAYARSGNQESPRSFAQKKDEE